MVTRFSKEAVKRLAKARKAAGLSARQLSTLAGLAENVCAIIERGRVKNPSFAVVSQLAHVLGLSLDWLGNGLGPEPTKASILAAVEAAQKARAAA
jgi:transcriptional regulator with XRE-family HTH domain